MDLATKIVGFDPFIPLEHASTIPNYWYFDPEIYEAERGILFNEWLALGRVDEIPTPGAYVTRIFAGEPLLALRDQAGTVRAFFNVCKHRGNCILAGAGTAEELACPYHGWVYNLLGEIKKVPEFGGVKHFCRDDHHLDTLQVAVHGPLLFVTQGREPLTLPLTLPAFPFVQRLEYRLACNWKLFIDNYLDGGYHVDSIHPALARGIDNRNYRTELHPAGSVQIAPLTGGLRGGTEARYWWLWPNLMIDIYEDFMDTMIVVPMGPESCEILIDFYMDEREQDRIDSADAIQKEDVEICERVQQGLKSRAARNIGRYSVKREAGQHQFHQMLARRLRGAFT